MPVLARITPDYLRDTIVEILFEADLSYDILKGLLYKELEEDFQLISNINPLGVFQLGPQHQFKFGGSPTLDFTDEEIKIQIHENRIIFNSLNAYPGWGRYFPKIRAVIARLNASGYVKRFVRVGIRYISEFPDILIFDKLNMSLHFAFTVGPSFNTTIRTEMELGGAMVGINLANNIRQQSPHQVGFFSIIDIDVIGVVPSDTAIDQLFEHIDRLHSIEKRVFQDLLKPEFLNTLNPEYE